MCEKRPRGKVTHFYLEGGHAEAYLRCLDTNAQSLANKQEELEVYTQSESSDVIKITKIKWDSIHDWNSVMEAVQGEQAMKKKGSCTFLQSTSFSMQRSSVKPETYLTGIFWSKAKAKVTLAMQPCVPVTHHLPKGTKWIRLSTNDYQKQSNYWSWSSLGISTMWAPWHCASNPGYF